MSNTPWPSDSSSDSSSESIRPLFSSLRSSEQSSTEAAYSVNRLVEVDASSDRPTDHEPDAPRDDEPADSASSDAGNGEVESAPVEALEQKLSRAEPQPIRLGVWVDDDRFGFVESVIDRLPDRFDVSTFHTFRAGIEDQVRADMKQVDLVWFEWAEGETLEIAHYTADTPALCRVHSNIANTDREQYIRHDHIDHWVFPAPGVASSFRARYQDQLDETRMSTIPVGVDVETTAFDPGRQPNAHIALYAPLGPEDNPTLLLQIIAALVERDDRFNVHITGAAQHPGIASYVRRQAERLGIDGHIHFYGTVSPGERQNWLDQCTYVLSTRIMDTDWTGVIEAMARGLKPVIHAFPGADQLFAPSMLFHTVEEAVEQFIDETPQPEQYRRFAKRRYQIDQAVHAFTRLFDRLAAEAYPDRMAAYHRAERENGAALPNANPRNLLDEARAAYEEGSIDEAASQVEQIAFDQLEAEETLEARMLALRVAMERETYTDALFHADAALDLAPDEPLILHLVGQALWAKEHREAAAEALIYAAELLENADVAARDIQFEVNKAQVYFMAGEACEAMELPDEALHFYEEAQHHAPEEEMIEDAMQRLSTDALAL